ncbi:putative quinol monooxygenase [Rhizobium ecuadorense]|uniref:putative quinol monooxygenase n=1 Tax=Rhizobium ecuadorense TaxID=1671795 RepID=UPI000A49D950|nr:antibiotic biosynthesis monooxygenase family protein [Rhizobium ecuadorense]
MSVNVIVQFKALTASLSAFQNIMEAVKVDLPKISGCRGVSVMQDLEDPCRFTLVEVWESQAKHAAHLENLVADGTWTSIACHLDTQPSTGYFRTL